MALNKPFYHPCHRKDQSLLEYALDFFNKQVFDQLLSAGLDLTQSIEIPSSLLPDKSQVALTNAVVFAIHFGNKDALKYLI